MNIAIIGVGRFGTNYLQTLKSLNITPSWVCSRTQKSINLALEISEINTKTTTDYKHILKDKNTNTVIISTPGSTHYDIAKDALLAGKHILVEKPVCLSLEHVKELKQISEKNNLIFMVGHLHLFNPGIQKIKQDIDLFGKPRFVQMTHTGNGPVRFDMSAVWDFAPHFISIMNYLFDEFPINTFLQGESFINKENEDVFTLDLNYKNKTFATLFASWIHPLKQMKIIISGDRGYAVFDDYAENKLIYYFNNQEKIIQLEKKYPLSEQVKYFINCIENNKRLENNNAKQAVLVTEIIEKSLTNFKNTA